MSAWEYDVVLMSLDWNEDAMRSYLNQRGADGWELVALGSVRQLSWRAVLKRPATT